MIRTGRTESLTARLTKLGFSDVTRAQGLCASPELDVFTKVITVDNPYLPYFANVADPDLALLTLVRLSASLLNVDAKMRTTWLQPFRGLEEDWNQSKAFERLLLVIGASTALADEIVRHPELLTVFHDDRLNQSPLVLDSKSVLLHSIEAREVDGLFVSELTYDEAVARMRRAYRKCIIAIACFDLVHVDPMSTVAEVAAHLADLAGAALEAALCIARGQLPNFGQEVALSVIGMGKCGGRELNYISDVDVIYVIEPRGDYTETQAIQVGTRLATTLRKVCSAPGTEPALWQVDAALRPEGKQGPLVRTLESHLIYYEKWAHTWEFQALLKARVVAGDQPLGQEYVARTRPFVWSAVGRENFVEDSQAMRKRVENHVPADQAERQIKLGKGGLRDVEFSVQLLQLVHGRGDVRIQSANTLEAIKALSLGGYIARNHAHELSRYYRFLRSLEHRIQLRDLRRTHLFPTSERALISLSRSMRLPLDGDGGLISQWKSTKRKVRDLHEELFYRPILSATAQLSAEEAVLSPQAAKERLSAIGYLDPAGAMKHIQVLTEGVSRRAAIQKQLLPVMIGWLAQGSSPDAGLLAFRNLSDALGSTHWFLKLLRDSKSAAFNLASILSRSAYLSESLSKSPEAVAWLGNSEDLQPREKEKLAQETTAVITRSMDDLEQATLLLRAIRRRELTRVACAQVLGQITQEQASVAITELSDLVIAGALALAENTTWTESKTELEQDKFSFGIVAMGRLGGQEMTYSSDADVLFVYDYQGREQGQVASLALKIATTLRSVLITPKSEPTFSIDADLRPEGRSGPLVRSIEAYGEYYERWSQIWEAQALLRARWICGAEQLQTQFEDLINPIRYRQTGLSGSEIIEIRKIKARVESERLPRGVDSARHLKLGRGGVSDVEWLVQFFQLKYAGQYQVLRTTTTTGALRKLVELGLIAEEQAKTLQDAWKLASSLRSATVLWTGRTTGDQLDILPRDSIALSGLASVLGYDQKNGSVLETDYLRASRKARLVFEELFYDSES